MKKVIFIVAALMAVFSGVAAVSAYEGHLVDIKAHVENALGVETDEWDLGTVFPQEIIESDLVFGLSESFLAQEAVSDVTYKLCWELKPAPLDGEGEPTICKPLTFEDAAGALTYYYQPLNPYLEILMSSDGDGIIAGADTKAVPAEGQAICWGTGEMLIIPGTDPLEGDFCDWVHLKFHVPVFEDYYNSITDAGLQPDWTYSMIDADDYCLVEETICGKTMEVPHADLGINLKIQVTNIVRHVD